MTSLTVAVVPLDDRAVNYECVALLGMAASVEILLPPKEWLGTPWRVGQMDRLGAWLRDVADRADALIVSIDTLGYGGLVNSRRSTDSTSQILTRLALLRNLKTARPELTILAYSVLMRISRIDNAEEEKSYWATYGARIFRMSYLEDRQTMAVATPAEREEFINLQREIPQDIVDDYRHGRARNHVVNRAMIEWTDEGIFDYLIIPQDDTVDFGWNIAEGRALRRYVQQLGLANRVSIYPGTDETDMLLLARYVVNQYGWQPAVWIRSSTGNIDAVITDYEDRSMIELIKAHLGPLGGVLAHNADAADILLYVNAPAEVQGNGPDQYPLLLTAEEIHKLPAPASEAVQRYRAEPWIANTLREMYAVGRNLPEFVRSLQRDLDAGHSCAVVDVAYVNAGDQALGDLLVQQCEMAQLAGYAGWNTAGNTLGSVLAQAVIRHVQRMHGAQHDALAAHVRLLFLRVVEDYLFMSRLRSQIMLETLPVLGTEAMLTHLGSHAETVRALVEARLQDAALALSTARFSDRTITAGETTLTIERLGVDEVTLPWQRLFDITLDVELISRRQSR